jgi:hypothetical protein
VFGYAAFEKLFLPRLPAAKAPLHNQEFTRFSQDFRETYANGFTHGSGDLIIAIKGFFVSGKNLWDKLGKIVPEQIRESRRKL